MLRIASTSPWLALALTALVACAGRTAPAGPSDPHSGADLSGHPLEGIASWYGPGFDGKQTASGEIYDSRDMTCAHRTLPFGTRVFVRNLDNGRTAWVRVNDRGPYIAGRIIDLSNAAARALDMVGPGTARVRLTLQRDDVARAADSPEREESTGAALWFVQVGAFGDRARAEKLADQFTGRGHAVVIRTAGEVHRVRVGPFPTQADADEELRAIQLDHDRVFVICDPC